jgi:hypothetical protein
MVKFMFIRFVSGEIDETSGVFAGLFCAASQLRWLAYPITSLRRWQN